MPKEEDWLGRRLSCPPFRVPIFLSYPSPTTKPQYELAEGIYRSLARQHLAPRTLGVNEYDLRAPLETVRRLISESRGLLAVAFRRTAIADGTTVRRHGREVPEEQRLTGAFMTSPWVQIEAAMAYQEGLPILVLLERGVHGDGLLEPGVVSHHMPIFDLGRPVTEFLHGADFRGTLQAWHRKVRAAPTGHFNGYRGQGLDL